MAGGAKERRPAVGRGRQRGTTGLVLRVAASLLLLAVAVPAGMLAWGALSNLWADYQDSPTSTYLLVGLPPLAACLGALVAALLIWRGRA
jgi:hypothetical protein